MKNIIKITTGQYYDTDYSEYVFSTNLNRQDIYDCNLNLTDKFLNWLKEFGYNNIVKEYYDRRKYFEIDFYHANNIDEVVF